VETKSKSFLLPVLDLLPDDILVLLFGFLWGLRPLQEFFPRSLVLLFLLPVPRLISMFLL
jgi:hypothetical protein